MSLPMVTVLTGNGGGAEVEADGCSEVSGAGGVDSVGGGSAGGLALSALVLDVVVWRCNGVVSGTGGASDGVAFAAALGWVVFILSYVPALSSG